MIAAIRPAMVEAGIVFHCEAIETVKHEEIRKVSVWEGKETVKTSFLVGPNLAKAKNLAK